MLRACPGATMQLWTSHPQYSQLRARMDQAGLTATDSSPAAADPAFGFLVHNDATDEGAAALSRLRRDFPGEPMLEGTTASMLHRITYESPDESAMAMATSPTPPLSDETGSFTSDSCTPDTTRRRRNLPPK